uniref:Leucine-rich repeat LGI family, member 2b n=1 Tax=Erpetoichthys calabaricus TaxID=27687 RepID=A0A8C4X440_ERPCA
MRALFRGLGPSFLSRNVYLKKNFRCPSSCSCSKESIICVGSSSVPRIVPNDINSLSIVNGTFSEIKEGMFSHMPSLQLLLLNSNSFTAIKDDAFSGLPHLEYLFIESNKIETTGKYAFRGLRDLTHLDLRGNTFECDCKAKCFLSWLKTTNATVSDIYCSGPEDMKRKKLNDLPSLNHECTSTGILEYKIYYKIGASCCSFFVIQRPLTLLSQSLSVDTFNYKNDVYVAIAQPNTENCMVSYDNITGQSIVGCKAILIEDQIFIVVAQLFGGSHIYKYDESHTKFAKFQDIEVTKISKPNDIEAFLIDKEWFFVIADSSKAGLTTLYKWNSKGFYSYQPLHEWFRDTDAEFVDLDGKPHLILASRSQVPVIFQWNRGSKKFIQQSEIQNMEDVVAVKSYRIKNDLYLSLTRFIGDSKILKWSNKQFSEIQALPSRGSMIMQPFSFKDRCYLALGSDYTFSQIYIWEEEKKNFVKFKEIYIQAPRSFTAVSTDRRDFIFISSFKGNTQIFEHTLVDLSL